MELSTRLEALLSAVESTPAAADIGTDHGFLPIELVRRGICRKVIACDVRSGPLERAKEHVRAAGLQDAIEVRLADGLAGLEKDEVQTVVIAGMGGNLMASILEKGDPEVIRSLKRMILQPQSEFDKLRKAAEKLGFYPVRERMLTDRGKTYWLMVMEPMPEGMESAYQESWQWDFGTILPKKKDPVLMEFVSHRQDVLHSLQKDLEEKNTEAAHNRLNEIEKELKDLQKVLVYGDLSEKEERQES